MVNESNAQTMAQLRNMALTEFPQKLRQAEEFAKERALGVVMETGMDNATVSLVAFINGSASLYFSTGGGVIGGEGREEIAIAAKRFTQFAGVHTSEMKSCSTFPQPRDGRTIFYVIAQEGAYTVEARESDLGSDEHAFSALFFAGQNVITHLRLLSEKTQEKKMHPQEDQKSEGSFSRGFGKWLRGLFK